MHQRIHNNLCSHQVTIGRYPGRDREGLLCFVLLHRCICPYSRNQSPAVIRQHQNQIQDSLSLYLAEDLQGFAVQGMMGANDSDSLEYLDVGSVT